MTEAAHLTPPAASMATTIGQKMRCSIKAKILAALLALSLPPLILCTAVLGIAMNDVRLRVESELLAAAKANLARLAHDQAAIANAMLDKIKTETRMVAYSARMLSSNPPASARRSSRSSNERPDDAETAPTFTLAPGVAKAAVGSELDRIGGLDDVFRMIRDNDPTLDTVYFGSQSGISRQYPGDAEAKETELPEIGAAEGYDPRRRPWYYVAALKREGVAWSKYANWGRGQRLFELDSATVGNVDAKVSASLVRALADKQIGVAEGSPIAVVGKEEWQLQDRNGKHYVLRSEAGRLTVYSVDILTCSLAVTAPDGRLAGVVGLDISMEAISQKIIHTPDEIPGYAFLQNERGELIEQERADMFVPDAGGDLRRKMAAGEAGIAFDAAGASWVAYAPIPSIHSADGKSKSYWSLGISMPQAEITRLADEIQRTMTTLLQSLAVVFLVITALIVAAAVRMSKSITSPILMLDEGARCIGAGNLDHHLEIKSGDEIEALSNAFNKMAGDLKTYIRNLEITTAEKERFASELRVAHEIQMSFLKKIFPPFPDRDDLTLYATLEPAREVGGDLFDFGFLDENRLVFYVGDVSDKGVPAALVMAMTMTLMKRAGQQPGTTPARILKEVNRALAEDNENAMFVTLFVGILDTRSGKLSFSNAGHNPPLILAADGSCRYLTLPDGLVLGVTPETNYTDDGVRMEPGDMIVTYTDGVTEAMSPERKLYSEERLQQTVAAMSGRSVDETVAAILASVKTHAAGAPQSDDITVLALKRTIRP
jgi:sigma-B regulation protein RsbU (phosphoserine phosphatase)